MKTKHKVILAVLVTLGLLVGGSMFLKFKLPPVVVAPEPLLYAGGIPITNTIFTALVVDIILVVLAVLATRKMELVPSGLQNFMEMVVETIHNMTESVAGSKWTPRFFAIVATIFLYVLISNWFGLIPGLAAVGFCEHGRHPVEVEEKLLPLEAPELLGHDYPGCEPGEIIIPIFRSPSTDLNNNLALAITSVFLTQVFGVMALGSRYFTKFFNIGGMIAAFNPKKRGENMGCAMAFVMGAIQFFVGILEGVSEFAKVLSFSFRLFGNIFAGEVMLLVLASLVPLVLTLPFLGLEVFVGAIQAFIFYILTVAFFTMATIAHDHQEEH